ncbi:MAG: tyrosine-type recombinase/integrase [Algoriphagus sp.]|nr:tyrosine-type recombinase/integrase [Algoriphagus sp.]
MDVPNLNFTLNLKKSTKEGLAPIYLRITINGSRTEISSKINVSPEKWDARQSKIKGNNPVDIRSNKILNELLVSVHQAIDLLKHNKFPINAPNIKLAINGKLFLAVKLIDCYEAYMKMLKTRIGIDYHKNSYQINETTFNHVKEFLIHEKKLDMPIDDFSNILFNRLEMFVKVTKVNSHNTTFKKIERFKAMFKWAYDMDYAKKDLSRKFKMKKQRKEIIFLTKEELDRIHELETSIPRLQIIKDCFLFMCYTGLAFKEIESLRVVNLSRNINGEYGLIITRQKTQKNIPEIPLLPKALELVEKYKHHPIRIREKKLFPIPSNQNFNSYLKEIGTLAKIEKSITTHMGRKTFATTIALRNGMSMEVVSKTLGHSNMRITQESYADLQNDRIREEFNKISLKLNSNDCNTTPFQEGLATS